MAWFLILGGCLFLIPTGSSAKLPLIATTVYVYTAFYSPGEWRPASDASTTDAHQVSALFLMSIRMPSYALKSGLWADQSRSECFPLSHREIGNGFAIFVNNTLSTILSLTYPSLLAAFKPTGGE